jgi:colanic acid biosynthesis glycosyl transferase WcaI
VSVPRLLLAYHFFHPDEVVSARIFSDFALEQQRRGWEVTVVTSNRSCFDPARSFDSFESWNGVAIHRVFRPPWTQARPFQRLANSGWMTAAWLARIAQLGPFDAIVVGSDPAFSPTLGRALRRLQPRAALVHWCFDLYPEAIAAEQGNGEGDRNGDSSATVSLLVPVARGLMKWAYGAYDALVDIGPRMQERLAAYRTEAVQRTLVPWALVEPPGAAAADPRVRAELYPHAKLALLYSGTMGRAHDFRAFLELARACRARSGGDVAICFSSRGNRQDQLRGAVTPDDSNVTFVPFADEAALQARLGAADVHLVSLQPEWAGIVVPSKFFGSLAVGRPLLYAGPGDSEIARWIGQYDVGLTLDGGDLAPVVERLHALIRQPDDLARWQGNAFAVYQREFSKRVVNDRWDEALRALIARRGGR